MVYKYTHVRFLAAGVIQSRSDKNCETQKCDVDGTIALNVSQYLYLSMIWFIWFGCSGKVLT